MSDIPFHQPPLPRSSRRALMQSTGLGLGSLALANSDFMTEQAAHFAERVIESVESGASLANQVEMAFRLALARSPKESELTFCVEHLRTQTTFFMGEKQNPEAAVRLALESLCLMLLASNEFLYIG